MRSDALFWRQNEAVGWSNFLTLHIPRNVVTRCGNFRSHATRASATRRARLLRSNENRVANSKHIPLARLSRVIRKNTGGSLTREGRTRKEGREHEAGTQRVKRQTADSRGLRREQKRKEGGKEGGGVRDKKGGIQGAHEGGKGPFPKRTQEGEKKGNTGGRETASERAGKREGQRLQRR